VRCWVMTVFSHLLVARPSAYGTRVKRIIQQRTIEAQGLKLNFTISECADANKKQYRPLAGAEVNIASGAEKRATVLDTSADLMKRGSAKCTLPASQCTCGIQCTGSHCTGVRSYMNPLDCGALVSALYGLGSTLDGTFIIEPGQTASVSYNTCTYGVINNEANAQEFCYSSFSPAASNLDFNCGFGLGYSDRIFEGYCSGGTANGVPRFFVEQINTAFI